jgi:hypothetical protein
MERRRFKHGTTFHFVVRAGREELERSIVPIESLNGAVTRCAVMYNRLAVSGGVSWWNPSTGYAIAKPKWSIELVDPSDELTEGQLCDCERCTTSG